MLDLAADNFGLIASVFFVVGAILGSFANVLIVRLPRHENIAWPGSHCQKCQAPVRWYDNLPILSYIILRGRCRACGVSYSPRYLVVELVMAILFTCCFAFLGLSWFLPEALIFTFGAVTASFIDLEHFILPDVFTLTGIVVGLVGAALNPERSFWSAIIGVIVGGGFLYLIAYAYAVLRGREGMGGGDIKLLGWIGAVLGWQVLPFVVIVSSLCGSLVGVMLAFRSGHGMKQVIPFGPFLAGAALLAMFLGEFAILQPLF